MYSDVLEFPAATPAFGKDTEHITNRTATVTDIFIFLDTSWEYDNVVDYINYVVQHLNIKPYGSSIVLLSARDASIMVNRTFYITDYYEKWNKTSHAWYRPGFSLPLILSKTQVLAETIMKEERESGSLGGRSMTAVLIPSPTAFIYNYDYDYCQNYVKYLNVSLPGLTLLFYAGGAAIRFEGFVNNIHEDLFILSYDLEVTAVAQPLVNRIRRVHRRLNNPRCSAYWYPLSTGSNQLVQYEGLSHINFYRLHPHYFFNEGSMRYLKVKPASPVAFTVCTSRSSPWPYRNPTLPYAKGDDCISITNSDFNYDLGDLCSNYDTFTDCPALYFSVEVQSFAAPSQINCTKPSCTTPDESEFLIIVNNLDCTNKASGVMLHQVFYLVIVRLVL